MKVIFGLLLLLAVASDQDEIQTVGEILHAIVDGIAKLLAAFAEALNRIVEEIKKAIKDNCDQNGGPGAYENLTKVCSEANDFYNSHFKGFQEEVEAAKKARNLSAVFKNYCRLSDPLIHHVHKLSDGAIKCSELEKKPKLQHLRNMAERAINYACERNGGRIALFVAEDGIECVMEKFGSLLVCGGNTTFEDLNKISSTIQNFEFNQGVCKKYKSIQKCIVDTLLLCKKTAPAKLVHYFLNEIYSSSPCSSFDAARTGFQLFVAQDGFECLNEKSEELKKCGNDAFGDTIQKTEVPKQECDELKQFQGCVVKVMSTCRKDMPSRIIEALFNRIYGLSQCPNLA